MGNEMKTEYFFCQLSSSGLYFFQEIIIQNSLRVEKHLCFKETIFKFKK